MKRRIQPRRLVLSALAVCTAVLVYVIFGTVRAYDDGHLPRAEVYFLDVGQSESILIVSGGDSVLIDGGTRDMGRRIVRDLRQIGIQHLTAVVATHPHQDHIGGLPEVLKEFPVDTVYMSDGKRNTKLYRRLIHAIRESGAPVVYPDIGDTIELEGGVTLRCLAPGRNAKYRYKDGYVNTWSLVYRLDAYGHSVLLTADTTKIAEREMLKRGEDVQCEVLKVAHHGEDTSTTDAFVEAVNPTYGVISYGADNIYGVPKPSVLQTLEKHNVKLMTTPEYGTVKLVMTRQYLRFTGEKESSIRNS